MPWMKTRPMADAAGCSERTLKRNMDVRGGCLNLGEHYRHGPSANSSYLWRADLVIEALSHRGMVAAEGRKLLLELTASEQKKLTNATICDAGQGPCNDPTLGELLLLKEIVNCPRYQAATDLDMAAWSFCAPNRARKRRWP